MRAPPCPVRPGLAATMPPDVGLRPRLPSCPPTGRGYCLLGPGVAQGRGRRAGGLWERIRGQGPACVPPAPTPDQRHSWDDRALCAGRPAQRAGHTPHPGAPRPPPSPGAGTGFTVGQPTPATCRAQRYGCLTSRGTGSGWAEVGAWHPAVVTQGPDCDLFCKHACPGTTPHPQP